MPLAARTSLARASGPCTAALVSLLIATVLLAASPTLAWLAAVWFGPENPTATFGANRGAAKILNGGDPVLGLSYLCLALASFTAAVSSVAALDSTPP